MAVILPFPAPAPEATPVDLAEKAHLYESAAVDMRYCADQLARVADNLGRGRMALAHDSIRRAMDALDRALDTLCPNDEEKGGD